MGCHSRSCARISTKAPPIWRLSSTPFLCIVASSKASWLGLMKKASSPGSEKSTCAANIVIEASRWSFSRPSRPRAAAPMASSVPPMQ
jgi:hypothetical protein